MSCVCLSKLLTWGCSVSSVETFLSPWTFPQICQSQAVPQSPGCWLPSRAEAWLQLSSSQGTRSSSALLKYCLSKIKPKVNFTQTSIENTIAFSYRKPCYPTVSGCFLKKAWLVTIRQQCHMSPAFPVWDSFTLWVAREQLGHRVWFSLKALCFKPAHFGCTEVPEESVQLTLSTDKVGQGSNDILH